jgi:homoserine O-acetyltransferase
MKVRVWLGLLFAVVGVATVGLTAAAAAQTRQEFADLGNLKLASGQTIDNCRLGYRTLGKLDASKSNAILFPTWFAGTSADAAQAVPQLFDASSYFVITVDALGDGVSCSPSNSHTQPGINFPHFSIADMVDAERILVTKRFGLTHLHAVVGNSMGGMQTFEWMVRYPSFMDIAIPIVGSPRLTSYDLLLWHTEEQAMLDDPAYHDGRYESTPDLRTVNLIHLMNVFTPEYRATHTSPAAFERFFEETESASSGSFDANDWRWQIDAMLSQDVAHHGSLHEAAKRVRAHVLVIVSQQDHMVYPAPALAFAALIGAKTIELHGDCGHAAPFCEAEKIRPAIDAMLHAGAK